MLPRGGLLILAVYTGLYGAPVPTYGTYFGGSGDANTAVAVAEDPSGNVIVAGYTTSQTLPGTPNAFQPTKATGFPDNKDVFVAKFDPSGRTLLWTTFLGGNGDDAPVALAVDASGSVYVAGTTQSSNFPATVSIFCEVGLSKPVALGQYCSTEPIGAAAGGFLSKISPDGRTLIYSVGFGDSEHGASVPTSLAVNALGEAYVGAVGPGVSGDLFLFRLNAAGTGLLYGSFLGGGDLSFSATIASLALDSNGDCYVAGSATLGIPVTANALQSQNSNGSLSPDLGNGFLLEVDPTGERPLYGTWFGPEYYATTITSITLASDGSLLFSGATSATSPQATAGAYQSSPGGGFMAKLSAASPRQLSAFSYLPSQSATEASIEGAGVGGAVTIDNASGIAYVLTHAQMLELVASNLAAASPDPTFNVPSSTGLSLSSIALAHSGGVWLVGACDPCALGNLIPSNAFQSSPQSATQSAILIQLSDISPAISFVGSSATGSSPFAAGQLVSIYGMQLGPPAGSGAQITPDDSVATSSGGTQALFDGIAEPILYAGAGQVNTVIPCSVAPHASTQVVVSYQGAQSAAVTLPLSSAAPGIFTVSGSGSGQGVVLNPDGSLNGPANPAPRGSEIAFYATGIGATSPCVDGQIYASNFPTAALPVAVGIGSIGAQVLYDGQAPFLISGVAQINVTVPNAAPTGVVPITLVVNGVTSPSGVTIVVK